MRPPLPSEARSVFHVDINDLHDDTGFDADDSDDHEETLDLCDEIRLLSEQVRCLADEQRSKLWELLRMPFAPLTILSSVAALAACARVIPQVLAGSISAGSVAYSGAKATTFYAEFMKRSAARNSAVDRIRSLLPHIQERDILIVRSLIDDIPEISRDRSDW